jgi:DNA-binding transcriptional LysR family regulator
VKKGYTVNDNLELANVSLGKRVVGFHVEAFAMLILSGCYIGFLPENYAKFWESKGEVRKLLPKRYETVVTFASMTARGRPSTVAQAAFLERLRDACQAIRNPSGAIPAATDEGAATKQSGQA